MLTEKLVELLREHSQRARLSKRLIDFLERDRRRIAMDLHDHVGQILTSCKIDLETMRIRLEAVDPELGGEIKTIEQKVTQLLKDVRDISRGLSPSTLDSLGLVPSLRELFTEIEREANIEIRFFCSGISKRLDREKGLAIYRIAQEGLTNVVKHARAKKVFVNLLKEGDMLSLSIEDDGVGFDKDEVLNVSQNGAPFGLLIARERAAQLGGKLTIESRVNEGTHLLLEIPC